MEAEAGAALPEANAAWAACRRGREGSRPAGPACGAAAFQNREDKFLLFSAPGNLSEPTPPRCSCRILHGWNPGTHYSSEAS